MAKSKRTKGCPKCPTEKCNQPEGHSNDCDDGTLYRDVEARRPPEMWTWDAKKQKFGWVKLSSLLTDTERKEMETRMDKAKPLSKKGIYEHFPHWDVHKGDWIDCDCGKPDCDSTLYADDFLQQTEEDEKVAEEQGWCAIFDQYCSTSEKVRSRCKLCGKRACEFCSVRTARVKPYPRWRICHKCLKKYGEEDIVDDHLDDLSELFGYDFRDLASPVKQLVISRVEIL